MNKKEELKSYNLSEHIKSNDLTISRVMHVNPNGFPYMNYMENHELKYLHFGIPGSAILRDKFLEACKAEGGDPFKLAESYLVTDLEGWTVDKDLFDRIHMLLLEEASASFIF